MKNKNKKKVCFKNPLNLLWVIPLTIVVCMATIIAFVIGAFTYSYYVLMILMVRDSRHYKIKINELVAEVQYKDLK